MAFCSLVLYVALYFIDKQACGHEVVYVSQNIVEILQDQLVIDDF